MHDGPIQPDDTNPDADHRDCAGGRLPSDAGLSVGELIRRAADGELSDEQVAEFDRLCAQRDCTKDRVRFEQTLRQACGKAMSDQPGCPEALRQRIASMAAGTQAGTQSGDVSVPESMSARTRSASFWRRAPGMLAAAAVLALFAGVLIFQSASFTNTPVPAGWTTEQVSNRDRMARFVAREHTRCCRSDRASEAKLIMRDLEQAQAQLARSLGVSDLTITGEPMLGESGGTVSFWGAGDCHVPASSVSGHIRFDAVSPSGEPMRLSLFVLPDQGQLPMNEGVTYQVGSEACQKAGVSLFAWTRSGVVYLLVSEADDGFCRVVRDAMDAPGELASF